MNSEQFDQYRAEYPMSKSRMVKWHSMLYSEYPQQDYFDQEAVGKFLDSINASRVIEVGGWRGEMAAFGFARSESIREWHNYEICREAASNPVCVDPRYSWHNRKLVNVPKCDTLICSHVLEHMTGGEVEALLGSTNAKNLYVDCPNLMKEWDGTTCFHVLELTWPKLNKLILGAGFEDAGGASDLVRWYAR